MEVGVEMSRHPAADLVEKGFCTDVMARDKDGVPCLVSSENAAYFCALGAISKAYKDSDDDIDRMNHTLHHHIEDQGYYCVQDWNDEVDQEVVVQTLKSLEI